MKIRQDPTDRFLIQEYIQGNPTMLAVLVKRYHKIFCEKAFWITKDKEIAKDTAQESWIVIIDKLPNLKNLDSFKNWAFRIVYTKAIDALKHENKEREKLKSNAILKLNIASPKIENNLIQEELLKGIQILPLEKQVIIRLFYVEKYTIKEISSFLKIPIGTVKSRLFKAREKLKLILKSYNHEK